MKQNILIDGRMISQTQHGISRYVLGLLKGLSTVSGSLPYQISVLCKKNSKALFQNYGINLDQIRLLEARSDFLSPAEWLEIPKIIKDNKFDLYHSPSFHSALSFHPESCSFVITVHDLIHKTSGTFSDQMYYNFILRPALRRAKQVVSVSRSSAELISKWSNLSPQNIKIAYNSIDADWGDEMPGAELSTLLQSLGLKKNAYFICLSNPKTHKNVDLLLRAFKSYCDQFKSNSLSLVVSRSISTYKQERVITLPELTDRQTKILVQSARTLLSPSLVEGFGLPPLEAIVAGTPVGLSSIEAHQEAFQFIRMPQISPVVSFLSPFKREEWVSLMALHTVSLKPTVPLSIKNSILERYSQSKLQGTMDEIYRSVLNSQKGKGI